MFYNLSTLTWCWGVFSKNITMPISYRPELYLLSFFSASELKSIHPDPLFLLVQTSSAIGQSVSLPVQKESGIQGQGIFSGFQEYFGFRKEGEREFKTSGVALQVAAPTPWSCTWTGVSAELHLCCSLCVFIKTQIVTVSLVRLPTSVISSPLFQASVIVTLLVLLSKKVLNIGPVGKNILHQTF